jgi:hypothetical protein
MRVWLHDPTIVDLWLVIHSRHGRYTRVSRVETSNGGGAQNSQMRRLYVLSCWCSIILRYTSIDKKASVLINSVLEFDISAMYLQASYQHLLISNRIGPMPTQFPGCICQYSTGTLYSSSIYNNRWMILKTTIGIMFW